MHRNKTYEEIYGIFVYFQFEAGLTDVISASSGGSFSSSLAHTFSSSTSETETQTTKITLKEDQCLWAEFLTYGDYKLKRAYWKLCPGRTLCKN